jgi:cyclohexanecarboxyl-CoA dehydrogenase
MLDFTFTPAQEEFRAQLRELALRELLPSYQLLDREERYPHELIRRVIRFCADFWKGREEEWDLVAVGITAEEVARGDFNCVLPSLGEPYRAQFLDHLSEAQRERWLEGLMSGEKVIGLAITEPSAGSDMGRLEARAERRGDRWVMNGVKNSVSYLNADVFYVFMRTDPEAKGWKGITSFLIPRDTPGLSFEPVPDLGGRAIPRGALRMEDVDVGDDALVGEPGTAFIRISRFFDVNRAVIGLKCVGAALQTLDETVSHACERVAFGGPLMGHQGVSFALAEAATFLEMARWQCYRVLWMRQRGIPCQREGAMAKWWAPKVCAEVIHKCLLFHGHRGYSLELPIQQRLRDVIGWQIGDGSEEVMKLIIARDLAAERSARPNRAT